MYTGSRTVVWLNGVAVHVNVLSNRSSQKGNQSDQWRIDAENKGENEAQNILGGVFMNNVRCSIQEIKLPFLKAYPTGLTSFSEKELELGCVAPNQHALRRSVSRKSAEEHLRPNGGSLPTDKSDVLLTSQQSDLHLEAQWSIYELSPTNDLNSWTTSLSRQPSGGQSALPNLLVACKYQHPNFHSIRHDPDCCLPPTQSALPDHLLLSQISSYVN